MGNKYKKYVAPVKKEKYAYPSRYGSHESMVVLDGEGPYLVCEDEKGFYLTSSNHLDNGMMDPWRITTPKFRKDMLDKHFPEGVKVDDSKPDA